MRLGPVVAKETLTIPATPPNSSMQLCSACSGGMGSAKCPECVLAERVEPVQAAPLIMTRPKRRRANSSK